MRGHKYRLGFFGHYLGVSLILLFVIILFPLFLFLLVFNKFFFWFYNQPAIDHRPFFRFDRHKIKHLGLIDKFGCEYCEWANGTLQWGLAIANKIEARFCPIKNSCDPHCEKAKEWRKNYLEYNHLPREMENYYKKQTGLDQRT